MSTINDSDLLLVERNGNLHQITYDQMSTLNDDDILLVERGGVQYKVEAQYISTGANGLIIPPVEVLTPINGAGITEFDQYEPLSSTITAVGEAGTIAKETDEILSVVDEAPIVSWDIADGSSPSFVNTDINFATELAAKGVTAITGINLYLDDVSGYPYTSNLGGFTLNNVDLVGAAQVSLISYNGTPYNSNYSWVSFFNGGGYNQCQGSTTYTCLFHPRSLGTVAKLKVLSVGGRVSLLDQDGAEHFIIGSSGKKVLSFPTNTNFSGLSVGDVVQGNPLNGTASVTQGYTFTDGRGNLDNLFNGVVTGNGTASSDYLNHLVQPNDAGGLPCTLTFDPPLSARSGTLKAYVTRYSAGNVNYTINGSAGHSVYAASNPVEDDTGVTSISTFTFDSNTGNAQLWGFSDGEGVLQHVDNVTVTAIDATAPSQQQADVYATWDPSKNPGSNTLSNGNLTITTPSSGISATGGTIAVSSGKWYYEFEVTNGGSTSVGFIKTSDSLSGFLGGTSGAYSYYSEPGYTKKINNNVRTNYGQSFSTGDTIGVALDLDAGTITFYVNGVSQGQAFSGLSGTFIPAVGDGTSQGGISGTANFGQNAWTHEPPTGYTGLSETETTYTYPNITVDGGTWDASNQSQVWSANVTNQHSTYTASQAFSGTISGSNIWGNNGSPSVLTLDSALDISGKTVVVYGGAMPGANQILINGKSITGWPTSTNSLTPLEITSQLSGDTTLTSIEVRATNAYFQGIEVDGQLLVDAVEDSQVWSNGTYTGTSPSNNYGVTDLFANVGKSGDAFGANKLWGLYQATGTFTLDNPIPLTPTSTLELITYQSGLSSGSITLTGSGGSLVPTLTVNGTNVLGKTTVSDPYASLGGSITSITIAAIGTDWTGIEGIIVDGKHVIDAGIRDLGDRKISSSISYEKSLTFTDTTELANMVGPLEMTDANGDVVTPVSDTIANVSGNTLTLASDTNLAYFQPGDEVQTGVQVVSVDEAAPSITVDGGSWYGADGTGSTYQISKSLRFDSASSSYLSRTPASAGNRKTWTWSGWIKRSKNSGSYQTIFSCATASVGQIFFDDNDKLQIYNETTGYEILKSSQVFRDFNSWDHFVFSFDTTESESDNRLRVYVNGVEITNWQVDRRSSLLTSNFEGVINSAVQHEMGGETVTNRFADFMLADVHFVDGQAIAPTEFGEFDSNGVWQAKKYDGVHNVEGTPGTINTLEFTGNGPHAFHAIRVDGTILTGADYTNGTLGSWSSNTTNPGGSFDGDITGGNLAYSNNGGAITWTSNGGLSYSSKVEIYVGQVSPFYVNINGGGASSALTVNSWNTIAESGAGVNGFHLDFADNSSDAALGYDANRTVTTGNSGPWASGFSSGVVSSGDTHSTNANTNTLNIDTAALGAYDITITKTGGANDIYLSTSDTNSGYNFLENNLTTVRITNTGTPSHTFSRWVQIAGSGGGNVTVTVTGTANGTLTGNSWTANNLTAATTTATYNAAYGSGITATEAAKVFDGDSSTYGVANSDFVGFSYSGISVKFKIENSSSSDRYFLVQPWVSGIVSNSGTFGNQSVGTVSGNQWTIPANSTGTAVFTFPSGYNGYGRLFPSNSGADQRIYYMVAGPADGGDIDSLADTPTSNHATLNPLDNGGLTLSNGNLQAVNSANSWVSARASIGMSSGKYYWEATFTAGTYMMVGISKSGATQTSYLAAVPTGWGWNNSDGAKYNQAGSTVYGSTYAVGDIVSIAFDADAGTLTFYKNGISQGTAFTGLTDGPYFPAISLHLNATAVFNFGQRSFAYPAPSGYQALSAVNFPERTIKDGSKHFNAITWTGEGNTNDRTFSTTFSPDLVWLKSSSHNNNHALFDSVRGFGENQLSTNSTAAEGSTVKGGYVKSVSDSSITLSAATSNGDNQYYNGNGYDYVAWMWDAGDTTETIAVDSLTSSVYDQSQVWSNWSAETGSLYIDGRRVSAFNNDFTNIGPGSQAHVIQWNGSISWSDKIEIMVANQASPSQSGNKGAWFFEFTHAGGTLTIDSSNWTGHNSTDAEISAGTIPFFDFTNQLVSPLTRIRVHGGAGSHQAIGIGGIKTDGKLLVDSGVSVDAVPSVPSEVRANPAAGFSVVKYTGDGSQSRVAHGLGKAPELVITKAITASSRWAVQMPTIIGGNYYLELNNPTGKQSWGSQTLNDPTSTTFDTVYANGVNESGVEYVGYCFAPVEGYSAIGSYTGNGSSDGPFVFTGFKPAFLLVKRTDGTAFWTIMDSTRDPHNVMTDQLYPHSNSSVGYGAVVDFLSNGFKIRSTSNEFNTAASYIYIAFAENPANMAVEVDTSGDTQVALDPLAAIATDILEIDGTTMYLNGATGPWRTGLSIEGSQINADPPGPSEITFTSQNQGTPVFSSVDATLASRTWTLESGASATGPWTLVDTYSDFGVLNTQTGATPWTENKPTLQPNSYYRIKVQYNSTNAESVESVYNTFKTGDA